MELEQFLNIFYKRIKIIIVLSVLVAFITALISLFVIKPVYESFATLYIINKNTDVDEPVNYNNVLVNQQLIKDYKELITSRLVTKAALDELKITSMTPDGLAGKISVSLKNDTRVLIIKVQDTDPVVAKKLANAVSIAFTQKAVNLMNVNNVNIVDGAEVPNAPVKPRPLLYTLLSFLITFIISFGFIYIIEYHNDTIKNAEEVELILKLNVIGIIPLTSIK